MLLAIVDSIFRRRRRTLVVEKETFKQEMVVLGMRTSQGIALERFHVLCGQPLLEVTVDACIIFDSAALWFQWLLMMHVLMLLHCSTNIILPWAPSISMLMPCPRV